METHKQVPKIKKTFPFLNKPFLNSLHFLCAAERKGVLLLLHIILIYTYNTVVIHYLMRMSILIVYNIKRNI